MPDPISWAHTGPYLASAFLIGYLLGSVPFGLIVARISGTGDIRRIGSGNIGATNVLRAGSKRLALVTLLLDIGKGVVPVLVGGEFGPDIQLIAALGAVTGHVFPVWLKFRGGKGVATALGVFLALSPILGASLVGLWLATAIVVRISSLASLVTIGLSAPLAWWLLSLQHAELAVMIAVLVYIKHGGNIGRLIRGAEPKIGNGNRTDVSG